MNYAIVEKQDREAIVAFINNVCDFEEYVLKNSNIQKVECTLNEFKNNNEYESGEYYVINNTMNIIYLVNKYLIVDKGYLYSTQSYKIDEIKLWRLVKCGVSIFDNLENKTIIESFNTSGIKKNTHINISGINFDDKKVVIKNILNQFTPDFHKHLLFVSNIKTCTQYLHNYFPEATFVDDFDEEIMNEFKAVVVLSCKNTNWMHKDFGKKLLADRNKMLITTFQYLLTEKLELVNNYDYLLIMNYKHKSNQIRFYRLFEDKFESFYNFKRFFEDITSDNGIIVLNNLNNTIAQLC